MQVGTTLSPPLAASSTSAIARFAAAESRRSRTARTAATCDASVAGSTVKTSRPLAMPPSANLFSPTTVRAPDSTDCACRQAA